MFNESFGEAQAHSSSIWSMCIHPTKRLLFSGGSDGHIQVNNHETHIQVYDIDPNGHLLYRQTLLNTGKVYSMIIMGDRLISASSNKTITVI